MLLEAQRYKHQGIHRICPLFSQVFSLRMVQCHQYPGLALKVPWNSKRTTRDVPCLHQADVEYEMGMEGNFSSCQRFKHELNCTARSCRTNHLSSICLASVYFRGSTFFFHLFHLTYWKMDSWSLDCWAFLTCDICDQGGLVRLYFRICWNATWKDATFHTLLKFAY